MSNIQINVGVLGATILSKATTSGLGSIQKPLYDKYIQYRKSGKGNKSIPARLQVSPEGITVIFPTDTPGHTQNYFYEKSSINFFEGVRFTWAKNDKKYQCAFLPIDERMSLNQGYDKLFSPLEKKHHNLIKMEHPAIISCVMRRPIGVRSLDCHAFVTQNDSDAYRIINAFCSEPMDHGRRGPDNDDFGGRYQFSPQSEGPKPDLIQTEYGPYEIYQGGKPLNLSDDHFRGHSRDSNRRNYNDEPEVNDRYIGRDNSKHGIRNERLEGGPVRPEPMYSKIDRHSGEIQHEPPRPVGFHRDEQNIHFRQRSGEYGDDRRGIDSNRQLTHRSGDGERHFEERGRIPTREECHVRIPRLTSPLRNQGPATAPKPNRALSPEPKFHRQDIRSPESPKASRGGMRNSGRELPLSPREFPPSGPISSVSNLESQQEQQTKKPVAKVPPHLVAGIKVLPTGFVPKLESPKSPRRKDIVGNIENYYSNEEDPYDNSMSRKDFYDARHNVHSEGYDPKHSEIEGRHYGNNPPPDVLPVEEKRQSNDRWRSEPEKDNLRYQNDKKTNRKSDPPGYGRPWSYGEQLGKFINKQRQEYDDSPEDDETQDLGGKMVVDKDGSTIEHDYANMFSKAKIKDDNDHFHTAGTNFESSLGYFP